MSTPTRLQRCRQWLREQIDAMATLRTANVRDLSFKNWRQNTVTTLQRIWPEDRECVERFRRIVFTPPHSRADAKLAREWFGKGIGESRGYLQTLLERIDAEGVPAFAEDGRDRDAGAMEAEIDFPMLDLSESAATALPTDDAEDDGREFTSGYATPDDQGASPRDPQSPAPPSLRMRWQAPTPSELRRREASRAVTPPALGESERKPANPVEDERPRIEIPRAPSLPPAESEASAPADAATTETPEKPRFPAPPAPVQSRVEATPAARRESPARPERRTKNGRGKPKKPVQKPKLKDLLGLDEFDSRVPGSSAEAPSGSSTEITPPAPVAATPPAAKPEPTPVAATPPAAKPEPAPVAATPPAAKPEPAPVRDHVAAVKSVPGSEPVKARTSVPTPDPPDEEDEVNEQDRERATLDFMQNSPVFGVVGKPVQRRTDTTEFLDPDAVAVATLAAELGRHGVPDGMRPSLSARLVDVAKGLEGGELDWALLRGAVTDAMQYPGLARRLLPVLLPWLERAA